MPAPSLSSGGTEASSAPSPSSGGTEASSAPSPTSSGSGRTFRYVPIQDNDMSGDCSVPIQAVVSRRNPTRTRPLGVRGSYAQNFVPSPRGWRKLCPFFALTHTGSLFALCSTTKISLWCWKSRHHASETKTRRSEGDEAEAQTETYQKSKGATCSEESNR